MIAVIFEVWPAEDGREPYLAIAADWGYAGLIGLIGVALAVAASLWRRRRDAWALIPAVTLANFIGLFQVAINTQTSYWLWMLVGGCAGVMAMRPSSSIPTPTALPVQRPREVTHAVS